MIYLADADSTLPNLALMRLAAHFRARGQNVRRIRPGDRRTLFDPVGDVYGSSIFRHAEKARAKIEREWGHVHWGGTGVRLDSSLSEVADIDWDSVAPDYSDYPGFSASIGFLTRGCRLRCGFCVVPQKEGKPRAVSTVRAIWRGDPHPRHLHLLDNDAFAPRDASGGDLRPFWREVVSEICAGGFRVCFSQGINLRKVDDEVAATLAALPCYVSDFEHRGLYTAWDSLGDETVFRRGIDALARAGMPSHRLTVYMLVGYDPRETWDDIWYRFGELVALGCDPYPMVYDRAARPDLCAYQRWVLRHLYRTVPWPEYARDGSADRRITGDARRESDAAWRRVVGRVDPGARGVR